MNYHASGLRVAEVASWVGAGWILNAGGMISRTVVGIPDDGVNGWFSKTTTSGIGLQQVAEGTEDSEPDMFNFNVLGYSGKFVFDINAQTSTTVEPMLIPRQDIKITRQYSGSNLTGFKLILPTGVVCYFGSYGGSSMVETSAPLSTASATTNGWYLMRIESHDQKHAITLTYETERYSYRYPASAEYYSMVQMSGCLSSGSSGTKYMSIYNTELAFNFIVGKRLTNISNSSGTISVDFETDNLVDRDDVDPHGGNVARPLDKIEINNGTYQKEFDFSYSYFTSPVDQYDIGNGTTSSSWYKRLKLNSIQEKSGDGTVTKNPYTFTYSGSSLIPQRLSRAVDHWGFANGKTLNGLNAVNVPATKVGNVTYGNADRSSSEVSMLHGMLTRVTYPTQGYTDYDYGANRYYFPATEFVERNAVTSCYVGGGPTCCTTAVSTGISFNLTAAEIADAEVALDIRLGENSPSNCANAPRFINLKLYTDAGVFIDNVSFGEGPNEPSELPGIRFDLTGTFPDPGFGPLSPGDYYFTLESDNGFGNAELYVKQAIEKDVGGMRIEAITHRSESGTILDQSTFDYTNAGNNQSSGVLYVEPVYGSQVFDAGNFYHIFWRDMSVVPLAGFDGYHIGYERVVETKPSNGYTEYLHSAEIGSTVITYPQTPDPYRAQNGKLDEVKIYNQSNTVLQSTTNTYTSTYTSLGTSPFKVFSFRHPNAGFGNACFYSKAESYTVRTGFNLISNEAKYADGMNYSTGYVYSLNNQLYPTQVNTTNSDGKVHSTRYAYAADILTPNVGNTIRSQNRILPAWRTLKYVDNVLVDGNYTAFSYFNTSGMPENSSTITDFVYPRHEYLYEYTWDQNGAVVTGFGWKIMSTVDKIQTNVGMPAEITIDGWVDPIELEWNLSGTQKKWTFIDHEKNYTYKAGSDLLDVFTAVDGTTLTYNWDKLIRLEDVTDSKGVVTELSYIYKNGSQPNRIDRKTTYPKLGSMTNHPLTTTTFFDDLGKTIQTLKWKQDPGNASNSIAEQLVYDNQARLIQQHEPITSSASPTAYSAALTDYTQTSYETSPLRRPTQVLPPQDLGSTILGRTTYQYGTNAASNVNDYVNGGFYPANSLKMVIETDGNGIETETYTDIVGNEILVRKKQGSNTANTYKLYDEKNRLTKIYPPDVTNSTEDKHFRILYSGDDQVVNKDDPDKGAEVFFYDDRELLTGRQDAKMAGQSTFYKIENDDYGRSIKEGFSDTEGGTITDVMIENTYGSSGVLKDKLTQQRKKVLNSNQFMTTNFVYDAVGRNTITRSNSVLYPGNDTTVDSLILDDADNIVEGYHKVKPKGLQVHTSNTYDHAGRNIEQEIQVTTPEGVWAAEQLYDRNYNAKELITQLRLGVASGSSQLQKIDYTYRDNRYLRSINASLETKDVFFMELGYENHVAANVTGQVPRNNGDISEWEWRYRTTSGSAGPLQAYRYKYNFLDMLTEAYYFENNKNNHYTTTYSYDDDRGNFNVVTRRKALTLIDNLDYDYKSNSNRLNEILDNTSNAAGFTETGQLYAQDANGFISYDAESEATITRDHLNHIKTINQSGVSISCARDASGQLHRTAIDEGGVKLNLDRIGNCEYRDGVLSVIHHDNGYITFNRAVPETLYLTGTTTTTKTEQAAGIRSERTISPPGNETNEASDQIELEPTFEVKLGAQYEAKIEDFPIQGLAYHYVVKDHLGSPRAVFQDINNNNQIDFATELEETKNYYAFGMEWDAPTQETAKYRNAYNNKERTPFTKYLDFGARNYIKTANVFDGPDPIASSFPHVTTINYAENSPISNIDLHGLQKFSFNELKQRGADLFNSVFGTNVQSQGRVKTTPLEKIDVAMEASGNLQVGLGVGFKTDILGVKTNFDVDIGSLKVLEASTTDGLHLIGQDGEVRSEMAVGGGAKISEKLKVGLQAERERSIKDGEVISDKSSGLAGARVGNTVLGFEKKADFDSGKSRETVFSFGFAGQVFLGAEGKFKISFSRPDQSEEK